VVLEERRKQRVVSVKVASEAPPIIAVLMQDNLVSRVNNEIDGVKNFIRQLPEGSRVMTGYITTGSLRVTQDFTQAILILGVVAHPGIDAFAHQFVASERRISPIQPAVFPVTRPTAIK
jgi:hypothetical protein